MEMNTPGMYRAHMDAEGNLNIKIYKEEWFINIDNLNWSFVYIIEINAE